MIMVIITKMIMLTLMIRMIIKIKIAIMLVLRVSSLKYKFKKFNNILLNFILRILLKYAE